jgi:hypothetical protein
LTCGRTIKCWLFTDDFLVYVPYVSHYLEEIWLTELIWKHINKWVFYIEMLYIRTNVLVFDIKQLLFELFS